MAKKRTPQDLSVDELRWLLMEKRRAARKDRLERFRRTGRVVSVTPNTENVPVEEWQVSQAEEAEETVTHPLRKRAVNGLLLVVELSAVAALFFLLVSGFNVLQDLNRDAASILEQPTLTPTPLIVAVVLPSGHTPPDSPGGARFNEAEIPEHLRPLVQSLAQVSAPTPGPGQAVRIQIPAIRVDAPVVQGDGWEQLKKGVGQHAGSPNPGEKGNVVLSAHNDIFGEIFRYLDRLQPGDEVVLHTGDRAHTYIVAKTDVVEPTSVEFMAPTKQPTVTLISCYPYLVDNKRIVVTARLSTGG